MTTEHRCGAVEYADRIGVGRIGENATHHLDRFDQDYEAFRVNMQTLFHDLGITSIAAGYISLGFPDPR